MKRKTNRREQNPKPRFVNTSGFGLHDGTLKDVEDKRENWRKDLDPDEIENWEEWL